MLSVPASFDRLGAARRQGQDAGKAVTGNGWAAEIAADSGLTEQFPGVIEFFTAYRNEKSLASFLGLVAVALVFSWRSGNRRKKR